MVGLSMHVPEGRYDFKSRGHSDSYKIVKGHSDSYKIDSTWI